MNKSHLKAITGVRFFAAMSVIAFHFSIHNSSLLPVFVNRVIQHGDIAVNFFFILSGFILAYNYVDTKINTHSFWLSRFARVYPLYLLALIIGVPFFIGTLDNWYYSSILTFGGRLIAEFTLLQAWIPTEGAYINSPGWSISVEALFYAIFPFIIIYLSNFGMRKIVIFMITTWIIAILVQAPLLILRWYITEKSISIVFANFMAYFPLLHLPGFLIGACAGTLFRRGHYFCIQNLSSFQKTLFEVSLIFICIFLIVNVQLYSMMNQAIILPFLVLFIFSLAVGGGIIAEFLALRFIVLLGEISYAIYILQIPISNLLRWIISIAGLSSHGSMIYAITYIPAIIGVSFLSYYLIEVPIRKRILKFAHAHSQRSSIDTHIVVHSGHA